MVKVKDFWNYLCNGLEYRFFSGVPHIVFKQLYKKMDKSFLHYVPAVNANAAVGLVNGVRLSGMNSAVIIGLKDLETCFSNILQFNFEYELPLVVIANKEKETLNHIEEFLFTNNVNAVDLSSDFTTDLNSIVDVTKNRMSLLLVEEGILI